MDVRVSGQKLFTMLNDTLTKQSETWTPLRLADSDTDQVNTMDCRIMSWDELTYGDRELALNWAQQLCKKFKFYPEVYALTSAILDKFLCMVKVKPRYLNCVCLSALQLAVKLQEEDEYSPTLKQIVEASRVTCSPGDVIRMERVILNKLNWLINLTTPLQFLQIFHSHLISLCPSLLYDSTPSRQLARLTQRLQTFSSTEEFAVTSPVIVGISVLSLELESFTKDWFPLTMSLLSLTQVSFSDLISCREAMSRDLMYYPQFSEPTHCSHHTKGKRKILEHVEQEDIYDSIKRLYNDEEGLSICNTIED